MTATAVTADVFVSHALAEAEAAEIVRRSIQAVGLDVFDPSDMAAGASINQALQGAIAEATTFVAVIDPRRPLPSSTAVEVGAAMAWQKDIYNCHYRRQWRASAVFSQSVSSLSALTG